MCADNEWCMEEVELECYDRCAEECGEDDDDCLDECMAWCIADTEDCGD